MERPQVYFLFFAKKEQGAAYGWVDNFQFSSCLEYEIAEAQSRLFSL